MKQYELLLQSGPTMSVKLRALKMKVYHRAYVRKILRNIETGVGEGVGGVSPKILGT